MKRNLVILSSLLVAGSAMAVGGSSGVFISEYIEGSSNNKAIEIYNGTGADIDMADYVLMRGSNGGPMTDHQFAYTGIVTDGDVYVIANSSAAQDILDEADFIGGSLTYYNGDDSVGLFEIAAGDTIMIDAVGVDGEDPGSNWDPPGTSNHTLVRMPDVTEGNPVWYGGAENEWLVYPSDTFDYLGSHDTGGNAPAQISDVTLMPDTPTPEDAVMVSAFVEDDGTVVEVMLHWGLADDALTETIPMSLPVYLNGTYTTVSPIPPMALGTEVFYQVTALDDEDATSSSDILSYTVSEPQTLTVAEIQGPGDASDYDGMSGITTSGIVQAVVYNGFYLQDAFALRSGIWVYGSYDVVLGDLVTVTGDVNEYYGLTEMANCEVTVVDSGQPLFDPFILAPGDINEDYESVFVRVEDVTCTSPTSGYGEWTVSDGNGEVMVDDQMWNVEAEVGDFYCFVQGMVYFSYGAYRINPRDDMDVLDCTPTLVDAPNSFDLKANFPNPFNPTTTIRYELASEGNVSIVVFDITGQQVATLVDDMMSAGSHEVVFDASALSSGIYFYQMKSGDFQMTQKMTLVK